MQDSVPAVRLLERGLVKLDTSPVADELRAFREGVRGCARAIAAGHFDRGAIPVLEGAPKG